MFPVESFPGDAWSNEATDYLCVKKGSGGNKKVPRAKITQRLAYMWSDHKPMWARVWLKPGNMEGGSTSLKSYDALLQAARVGDGFTIERLLQISEPALKALLRLVLMEKGPLPVGEIGKMLQDACSVVATMSTVLKERFGGLKKFLERHPDDFILANDHPFNPNVYLKDTLTVDEFSAITRGESISRSSVSSHSTMNTNGTGKARNRRNSRTGVNRKKSPAPTMPLSPDQYLMPAGNNFSRTMSSNSLEHSGGGPAPKYRSMLVGGNDTMSPGIAHDLDNRVRTKSTPTQQLGNGSHLRGLGLPDPSAPEFVPAWGSTMK